MFFIIEKQILQEKQVNPPCTNMWLKSGQLSSDLDYRCKTVMDEFQTENGLWSEFELFLWNFSFYVDHIFSMLDAGTCF